MLGDLIAEVAKLKSKSEGIIKSIPLMEMTPQECIEFEKFSKEKMNLNCICRQTSLQVETSPDHWAVCSNQYLALAAIAYDFSMCLKKYFDFLDKNIRYAKDYVKSVIDLQTKYSNKEIKEFEDIDAFLKGENVKPYIDHISQYPDDKNSLCYFLAGIGVKMFGNVLKGFRGTTDLFGAYILSIEPVTNAASGFLGTLCAELSSDEPYFAKLKRKYEDTEKRFEQMKSANETKSTAEQIIFYGVPGCGKSKTVKDKLCSVDEFTRFVFHADFSNADFIGQILPETVKGNVQYKYKPSAFIKMLKDAYKNPEKKYALIIEELNRGNAPAIFGSLFQLLDRKASTQQTETINGNTYGIGWSDYSVSLENVNAYFRTEDGFDSPDESTVLGGITITAKEGIRFPKNLSIYATMNTSDQNVFTLDNAFQRRWSMQMVSNELKDESQKNLLIGNTGITWEKFRNAMNARIIAASNFSSLEDRRLGGWFILKDSFVFVFENGSQESKDAISKQAFANKVIKYLWDDAFKFDRSIFVNSEGKTLEDVINDFNNDEIGMKIFDAEFNQAINA